MAPRFAGLTEIAAHSGKEKAMAEANPNSGSKVVILNPDGSTKPAPGFTGSFNVTVPKPKAK